MAPLRANGATISIFRSRRNVLSPFGANQRTRGIARDGQFPLCKRCCGRIGAHAKYSDVGPDLANPKYGIDWTVNEGHQVAATIDSFVAVPVGI